MTAIDLLYARRRKVSREQSAMLERYAYHGTSKSILKAVRAVGLVPQVGDRTKDAEGHDVEAKVCLAADRAEAQTYADRHDDGGVVLQVDIDHPGLAGATPKHDEHADDAVEVNQRIPPEAIKVLKPRESTALALARWSEGYARDLKLKAQVQEAEWRPRAAEIAQEYGFVPTIQQNMGKLGNVIRFTHPRGDQLVVTNRQDLTAPINQHAGFRDRMQGSGSNWSTRWEYHSLDGVKSTGYDVMGLQAHLQAMHPRPNINKE